MPVMNRLLAVNFVAAAWVLSALQAAPVAATASDDRIATIDGRTITGTIESIDGQGLIRLADGSGLKFFDVLGIDRGLDATASNSDSTLQLHLAYGGMLSAQSVELKNERVSLVTSFGSLELPIESVRAIVFKPSALSDAVRNNIATPSNQFDTVWAESNQGLQAVEGFIQSIGDGKISGEFQGEQRSIQQAKVIAYIAANLGLKPQPGLASCQLADGSSLRGAVESLSGGTLSIRIPGGGRAEIPWSTVVQIDIESDRLKWLSDLIPVSNEQEPMVTTAMEAQFNRSVGGNPLTLRSSQQPTPLVFAKGIGVHAFSRLAFDNESNFDRLVGTVGIDAETQGNGDCVFIVRGDGVELWARRVRAGEDPQPLDVDVSNVREINLIVEPGEALDLGDHADWCNVRLLRTH